MERNISPTNPLWRWRELCEALGIPQREGPDIDSVSIDSRTLGPGSLFIALDGSTGPVLTAGKGAGNDGHSFVRHASTRGAVAAMVHKAVDADIPLLRVKDTREGLWQLGAASRARFEGVVFAITGSAGKTTAKSLLAELTGGFATSGSLNNVWGVPLSLALAPRAALAGVFEIGMNHADEIAPLAKIVQPDVAVVLNALPAHLQAFASVDEIREEKLSIHQGLVGAGVLVLPEEMDSRSVPSSVRRFTFGRSPTADLSYASTDESWQRVRLDHGSEWIETRVPGGGEHRAQTLAAVAACAIAGGFPLQSVARLSEHQVPTGRGVELQVAGIWVLDDSYNANPVSMSHAVRQLESHKGRRFAVLGEMLELGESGLQAHANLARQASGLDGVWCVGELARATFNELSEGARKGWFPEAGEALIQSLVSELREGDTLLVKGSNRVFWVGGFVPRLVEALSVSS